MNSVTEVPLVCLLKDLLEILSSIFRNLLLLDDLELEPELRSSVSSPLLLDGLRFDFLFWPELFFFCCNFLTSVRFVSSHKGAPHTHTPPHTHTHTPPHIQEN